MEVENGNISFFLEEKEPKEEFDLNLLWWDFHKNEENLTAATVNDLLKICDYYDLTKNIKLAKYKKKEIIHIIQYFEIQEANLQIVEKRKKIWAFLNELKADKKLKKYVIW